jgi:hypothetical protein
MAGSYRYKLSSGQEVEYGDPMLNRGALSGAMFLGQAGNASATDPLLAAAPSPSVPIQRSIDPNLQAAEQHLNTFKAPETAEQIAERKRKQSQGLIDSINTVYDDEVAASRTRGQERVSMDNAVAVLSGLMGGTEAVRTRNAVNEKNDKEVQAINNKRATDLARIYTTISSDADAEAREQAADATRSAEEIVARRSAAQAKALESVKGIAAGGLVDFDSFRSSPQNAKVYEYAVDAAGSEEALRAAFMLNRPQDQIVGTPVRMGNKYVQAYQNPLTGKVKYESLDLPVDLPDTYSSFQKLGDNLVAIPENWDGDTTKLRTIAGSPSTMERLQQQSLLLDIQKKQADLSDSGETTQKAQQKAEALTLAEELRKDDAVGKKSAIGASAAKLVPWGRSLGLQGDRAAFEAKVDTLKANLTLDNLKLLKGAMSDKDLAFLQAVGSSLNTDMSESAFNTELDKIITKLGGIPPYGAVDLSTAQLGAQLQPGEILVKDKATGQIGAIPEGEFDASLYEKQ